VGPVEFFQVVVKNPFDGIYLYSICIIVSSHLFLYPQRSSGNVLEYSFSRISWNLPWLMF